MGVFIYKGVLTYAYYLGILGIKLGNLGRLSGMYLAHLASIYQSRPVLLIQALCVYRIAYSLEPPIACQAQFCHRPCICTLFREEQRDCGRTMIFYTIFRYNILHVSMIFQPDMVRFLIVYLYFQKTS